MANIDSSINTKGANGVTPHIDSETGNWFIGEENTGVKAAGTNGTNGREITLQVTEEYIQWKYDGEESWNNLVSLASLKGPKGDKGDDGVSVTRIEKTNNEGLVDTYTITLSNGTTATFTVTKGAKGDKGDKGDQGDPGQNGQDGTSVYIGYDGYIWSGTERTNFKLENAVVDPNLAEDTLMLYGNKYFVENEVDLGKPLALMGNYFPTIKKTGYSGTTISEIKVYAKEAGSIRVGTASVENIIYARTHGTNLTHLWI